MSGDEEYETLGKMFFILSKSEDETLLKPWELEEQDVSAGWVYFGSLTDSAGGITLITFQEQVRKIVKRTIKSLELRIKCHLSE